MVRRFAIALFGLIIFISSNAWAQPEFWKREGWKTDFTKTSIDYSEILSGGPPRDGIPSLDDPQFIPVAGDKTLSDRDPVVGISINGDARAYPLRILTWHEIANDVVGGVPLVITFCPLCNSAIVYKATVNGKVLKFGTTGKLRNSDLVMYDRTTDSWWQQFLGEGIAGDYTGTVLDLVPSRLESWKEFKTRFPEGKVLVPNNPLMRNYGSNPYVNYDISARPFLYRGSMPEGIEPMERVVVIRPGGDKKPFVIAMKAVAEKGTMTEGDMTISWRAGQASALNNATIANGKDVGTITVTRMEDGKKTDVNYDVTFAFVAHAFHPDSPIQQ